LCFLPSPTNYPHVGVDECLDCHDEDNLTVHYEGDCSDCHSYSDYWAIADYDHDQATECVSCHLLDAPPSQLAHTCIRCHSPEDAGLVSASPRQACRAITIDEPHYQGPCGQCHNTLNWGAIRFDHTGHTDCRDCHFYDSPLVHMSGQCSTCHITASWDEIHFDHTGYLDCVGCHGAIAPDPHYVGQCSRCHNTQTWLAVLSM